MFYSHEILTSPEHGVATVWLAATLGPKSTTRKINRKAILDVNVSGACKMITDPEIPMALRLQGSMLYGVSRVYNQQCGYTLLDAQAMHDRMISMLKLLAGGGLDPNAGKTKASSLILPYDPSFLPETGLPGLNLDLSIFGINPNPNPNSSNRLSGFWNKSVESQSTFSQSNLNQMLQIELPNEDSTVPIMAPVEDGSQFGPGVKVGLFGKRSFPFERADEEGVLLQPDFEFDEDGNIVELSGRLSPKKRRKIASMPGLGEDSVSGQQPRNEIILLNQAEDLVLNQAIMNLNTGIQPTIEDPKLPQLEDEILLDPTEIYRASSRKRPLRELILDESTTLRNTDLYLSNKDYLINMARALKQKNHNKIPTIAKRNAAFWVYGQGIGSVGAGLGANREPQPLNMFSGKILYESLTGMQLQNEGNGTGTGTAAGVSKGTLNSTVRKTQEKTIPAADLDVEFARHAPSSIMDDHSSQMPWNISASIHSSDRFGSQSLNLDPRFESARTGVGGGVGAGVAARYRITSSSPLAGRSRFQDSTQFENDEDGEMDITRYLGNELASDRENVSILSGRKGGPGGHGDGGVEIEIERQRQRMIRGRRDLESLDLESLNFYEFICGSVSAGNLGGAGAGAASGRDGEEGGCDGTGLVAFGEILPPRETSRVVATQAFMNVLTLASEGWLVVSQERNGRARFGDIFIGVVSEVTTS